jgi:geranylgeranyl transferase type-2 subunit beta
LSYLEDLTLRLAAGLERIPEPWRERHAAFLKSYQQQDGGFAGREGGSDLYYTGFAARGLVLVGELHGQVAEATGAFLKSRLTSQAPIVDFLSLIYAGMLLELSAGIEVFDECAENWRESVATALENFRRADGGYAKGPEGVKSSTYHSFLVLLCHELIQTETSQPGRVVDFIMSQQRDDGGFVEIAPMKRSGTNPTAAAVGALKILGGLNAEVREDAAEFLAEMQTDEGGLRANTRIPIADLLSTFTGLLTLQDLDAAELVNGEEIRKYAESLQHEDGIGGFQGAVWDEGRDVEYTFYGLGTLALA